jgi:hypothetical protein
MPGMYNFLQPVTTMPSGEPSAFLEELAPHIIAELKPPSELKKFTRNSAVVGAYVEAGIRQLVRRYLAPIRVSTGAVIDQAQKPGSKEIPQLDTIAWIPGPVSGVFEIGEFALVPRSSCLGILEIKSSAYAKAVKELEKRTDPKFVNSLTADIGDTNGREAEFQGYIDGGQSFSLGVVSVLRKDQLAIRKIKELREKGRVVVIFEEADQKFEAQKRDIYRLVNFLGMLRLRATLRDGRVGVRVGLVK